jgi:hypothetical protein
MSPLVSISSAVTLLSIVTVPLLPKCGIQFAVGVEPCNATGIRPTGVLNNVADHDLSVRLHSQGLRNVMEPAEPEGRGTEAGIQHPGFAEKLTFVSVPPQSEPPSQ